MTDGYVPYEDEKPDIGKPGMGEVPWIEQLRKVNEVAEEVIALTSDDPPLSDMEQSHRLPVRWGDSQQYYQDRRFTMDSSPGSDDGSQGVVPKVTLLSMTPEPLRAIAAMAAMYEGRVVRDLSELPDEYVREKWNDVLATHLDTPLEAVQLHFLIEGVDRAFTHQLVRQRVGAAYAQESLRFAVVDDLKNATTLPPSLAGTRSAADMLGESRVTKQEDWRLTWDATLEMINNAYRRLVDSGMPAEEARGLLPHCTATRAHYVTNLRALADHAGNRLCTQAQFHWREVFAQIIHAIRTYRPLERMHGADLMDQLGWIDDVWQYETIADSSLFRPICYKLNKCPFKASFDRECSIRERVQALGKHGVDSSHWNVPNIVSVLTEKEGSGYRGDEWTIPAINSAEWLVNPGAARKK